MALHEQSRRLFPAAGGRGLKRSMSEGIPPRDDAPTDDADFWSAVARQQQLQHHLPHSLHVASTDGLSDAVVDDPDQHALTMVATTPPQPVMHWTSEERRRREYAAIDRRSKGIRGLWNRLLPRFARSETKSRFYDEERDGSDAGSVRRHRIK
jgi:hypothetical protein